MITQAVVSLLLLFFVSGCATLPRAPVGPSVPLSLEGLCRKYNLECGWDGVSQTVTMDYHGQRVQAMVGSSMVLKGDARIALSAPLKREKGLVIVPWDFEKFVFAAPLLGKREGLSFAGRRLGRVMVDAGHGGKDPGAMGFGSLREKEIVLDIAKRVASRFKNEGIDAVLTRDHDEFITLADRTEKASNLGIDVFISIHANSTKSKRARGYEVYYAPRLDVADKTDHQRLSNEKQFCRLLNMKQDSIPLRGIVAGLLYDNKLSEGVLLAEAVSSGLYEQLGQGSRGSKAARFFVLRNTLVPAVLVEVGFVSNLSEAMLLKQEAYREKIAQAIVKSVLRYVYAAGR